LCASRSGVQESISTEPLEKEKGKKTLGVKSERGLGNQATEEVAHKQGDQNFRLLDNCLLWVDFWIFWKKSFLWYFSTEKVF
jgi:hypothetical protein